MVRPADRMRQRLARVPGERRKPYDMRRIVKLVFDRGSLFEIQPTWGKGVITSFARLGCRVPVGVVANNPMCLGVEPLQHPERA
jgi:acetyl-CoA carboxylase carboxyltransferase component